MAERLTDTIADLVTSDQVARLGATLGTTPASAGRAVRQAVASLVTGLAEMATPAGGTTRVGEILAREGITGTERLDEHIDRGTDADGSALAREILGRDAERAATELSADAGLESADDGHRALGLVAPLVVSALARRQRDHSLSAASVGALLISERDELAAAAGTDATAIVPAEAEAQLAAKAVEATRDEAARHEEDERRRRRYVWPFVALFAIVGVIIAVVLALTLGGDEGSEAAPPPDPAPASEPVPADPPPPEPELPDTVILVAEDDGEFGTMLAALEAADLTEALRAPGPISLLAPTNAAFDALPEGALEGILADPERLDELLTAHIVEGTHFKSALADRTEVTTQDGRDLAIATSGSDVSIAGATIVKADLEAKNGILQGLDGVIVPDGFELIPPPPVTVVDVAGESSQFSTLLTALDTANLTATLQGEGPFTVFAPTNEAFDALPEGTLDAIIADAAALEQLLTAHVTGGVHDSAALGERNDLTMLTGLVLPLASDVSGITIGDARITAADIQADNGIIHVIDTVIVPPDLTLGGDGTVIDALEQAGQFGELLASLERAGLTDTLRGPGPFTLLAFTDDAFAALPGPVRRQLADDDALLGNVVAAHYSNNAAEAAAIAESSSFLVSSGEEIGVVTDGELIWVGGARIVETIESTNAVIHVIDRVIIPASFGAAEGTVNDLLALAPVQFEVGSADLTPAGRRVLSRAVAYLTTNPVTVEIGGHTDSDGEEESNQALSEERAQTVLDFLVDAGVDESTLSAVGYGATQPVASNDTERGKARNRRIDFTILG